MDERLEAVMDIAGQYGLSLDESSLAIEDMGLDFQVVFAADHSKQGWVLRLPRRKDAYEKVVQEKRVLDFIAASQDTFAVPHWEIFETDLIAYKKLGGDPAVTTDINTGEEHWAFDKDEVPENYTRSLGRAMAALHNISVEAARETGMEMHTAGELRDLMKSRMERVRSNFEVNDKLWDEWMQWLGNDEIWPGQTAIIHGDLFPGHTLVDHDDVVTGIIDWTEAKVSDPANDFAAFYLLFGDAELDKLIDVYESADGYTWAGMKSHIIGLLNTQAITIAEFAESSGLEAYRKMAEDMLLGK